MDTIRVQRANVILDIRPDEKAKYMEQGYSVIDKAGNILEAALSKNVDELRCEVKKLRSEVADRDVEITDLLAKVEALEKELEETKVSLSGELEKSEALKAELEKSEALRAELEKGAGKSK